VSAVSERKSSILNNELTINGLVIRFSTLLQIHSQRSRRRGFFRQAPEPDASVAEPGMTVSGATGRTEYPHPNDDFAQPRALFRDVMTDTDRDHLISNIVGHLKNAQERIQLRQCAVFYCVDPEYGTRVAQGVGVDVTEVAHLAGMPVEEREMATVG
jgi:catalase